MTTPRSTEPPIRSWLNRTVVGIVLATFFSDVGHEMVTAVLPMYLASVGLGAAALGTMEGLADFVFALSKLAGGVVGHHVERKRHWATAGYLTTAFGTTAMAFVRSSAGLSGLRAGAWFGRGFRAPLRDFMLADAVPKTHFGRAYGIERSGDMLGAVAGPLFALILLWFGCEFRTIIFASFAPSLLSAASIFFVTRDRTDPGAGAPEETLSRASRLSKSFWLFLGGVLLFGLGDFSRTFLILLAARTFGADATRPSGLSVAVLLYAFHNLTSAVAAYPIGHLGDRSSKLRVLLGGYALGVVTNVILAFGSARAVGLAIAMLLSGVYIAVEETLEKAVAVELLPREIRSLGLGILATSNAVGDMASSVAVGVLLARDEAPLAFGLAALAGAVGVVWMSLFARSARAFRVNA